MKLTRFQTHVLKVIRAIGPADFDQIQKHCRQHRKAIRKATYRLRSVGLVDRIEQMHDVTVTGREHLSAHKKNPPRKSNEKVCRTNP